MTPMFNERPPRLRARRRNRRIILAGISLLCAIGAVGGLAAASHLEQFAIADISVRGTTHLNPESLAASVSATIRDGTFRLFSRENMFLYPRSTIVERLESEFPRIKDVSVARESFLAQAVVVSVVEREPFAQWCSRDDACFVMDESGFIYAEAGEGSAKTHYVFRGGLAFGRNVIGQTFLRGRIRDMVAFLDELNRAGFAANGITVDSEKDFTVVLAKGPALLVSFGVDSNTVLRNLETALEADSLRGRFEELSYIDLRFGNRVYYK